MAVFTALTIGGIHLILAYSWFRWWVHASTHGFIHPSHPSLQLVPLVSTRIHPWFRSFISWSDTEKQTLKSGLRCWAAGGNRSPVAISSHAACIGGVYMHPPMVSFMHLMVSFIHLIVTYSWFRWWVHASTHGFIHPSHPSLQLVPLVSTRIHPWFHSSISS
jgi:hypothetical protein